MSRDGSGKSSGMSETLDDPGDVGGTIELIHLTRNGDILIDDGVVIGDHILVLVILGSFERIRLTAKELTPDGSGDEL